MTDSGLTLTDCMAMYLGFLPNNISIPIYFIVGKKANNYISEFCHQFASLGELSVTTGNNITL